jgi:hypothetical protein
LGCRPPSNRRSKSRPLWGLLRVSKIEYDFTLSDSADERFAAGGSHSGGPFHPTVCCARCCYKPLIQSVLNASLREQFNSPAKPPALPERIEAARCIRRRVPVTSRLLGRARSEVGPVSRVTPVQTAMRNCTRDEGRPFEVGNQVLISSHRKLLSSKAMVVNVAEKPERDSGRHD